MALCVMWISAVKGTLEFFSSNRQDGSDILLSSRDSFTRDSCLGPRLEVISLFSILITLAVLITFFSFISVKLNQSAPLVYITSIPRFPRGETRETDSAFTQSQQ